jgi:hypothetical protein
VFLNLCKQEHDILCVHYCLSIYFCIICMYLKDVYFCTGVIHIHQTIFLHAKNVVTVVIIVVYVIMPGNLSVIMM